MDEPTPARGRLKAAWTLIILVPICAELTFTAVAVPLTWLALPLLIPIYGAGVLLIREATVRVGGGWPSLVVLGLAYELAEDGLGLQALTSPNMYDVSDWSLRVLGLNLTYWESQIGIHVVFSVLLPLMLMDLLFPHHKNRPYLRTGGLITTAVTAILGVALLRFTIAAAQDPGYQTPTSALIGFTLTIATLAFIALKLLPGRTPSAKPLPIAPVPVGVLAAAATIGFLGLLMPFGLAPGGPVFGDTIPLWLPLIGSALIAIATTWLIRRWTAAPTWSDTHRLWLAGGALVAHTAFMMPGQPLPGQLTGAATIAVEIVALFLLSRILKRRTTL
ncbi:hypothetical protein [Stackebrandtia nassauensis]|uniref:Uncharacterized protein n=1 Tax=Stackebrandtia nassauensis (strain DSM 44728 / CIP 108903 / NRRL B-16338 / NBRC 102104 / LLR-40K-21) TaxID=446470 RepID=D3QC40_STANL|nr:hypothetical protein [Stackebrandtia nassauensis]ADD39760.1 hypothetical protein Snas_0038 [Stackebrandtia nassauensis DSM 44728]